MLLLLFHDPIPAGREPFSDLRHIHLPVLVRPAQKCAQRGKRLAPSLLQPQLLSDKSPKNTAAALSTRHAQKIAPVCLGKVPAAACIAGPFGDCMISRSIASRSCGSRLLP